MAVTGHKLLESVANLIVVPERKGSVLLALIRINIIDTLGLNVTSEVDRWDDGSNLVGEGQVYSDTRRRPKKARRIVARNIALSAGEKPDRDK